LQHAYGEDAMGRTQVFDWFRRFKGTEDIKRNSTKTLLDIPKEEFANCFQQWQKRWAKCVAAERKYVEDNNV